MTEGYLYSFKTSPKAWLKKELAWQQEILTGSRVVATKNGMMEYAMIGDGPVVIGVHGMPGGFDQGIFEFDWIALAGFRLLAPSRQGYLPTPPAQYRKNLH